MKINILRLNGVKAKTGDSRTIIYENMTKGLFPKQIRLGARCVGWPEHEVDAVNAARIVEQTPEELRALVIQLEQNRGSLLSGVLTKLNLTQSDLFLENSS